MEIGNRLLYVVAASQMRDRRYREPIGAPERRRAGGDGILHSLRAGRPPVIPGAVSQGPPGSKRPGKERRLSGHIFLSRDAGTDLHGCGLRQVTEGESFRGDQHELERLAAQTKKGAREGG